MRYNNKWLEVGYYKSHNFNNIVESYDLTVEPSTTKVEHSITQPVWTQSQSIQDLPFLAKTGWNTEMFSNGTMEAEVIFGPRKRTEFKQFINTKVSEHGLNRQVNIKQGNGIMTDFERMITYNKLTNDYGWYNVPVNATYGEMLYQTNETSFITKKSYDVPSDEKIAEMQAAGLVSSSFTVNDPFRKAKFTQPVIRSWAPTPNANGHLLGNRFCLSFFYRNAQDKTINQYKDWHSIAWIKRAGHEMQIRRLGAGRNYIIPLSKMGVKAGEDNSARRNTLLNPGRPVLLESSHAAIHPAQQGYIIHVYEINTQ